MPVRTIATLLVCAALGCADRTEVERASTELVVAAPADAYGSTPDAIFGIYPVNASLYEPLVRLTPDYQVEPWLATEWEFVPPNTWRFHLRRGVRMHDGRPFTAEAVRWSLGRLARIGGGTLGVDENSVRVLDDHTVEITPARPNRRLLQQLAHPNRGMIAPGTDPAERTVGTGPFRRVEYVRRSHLVVERFPEYWGAPPRLERLTFRFVPDPSTRLLALRSGEVDVAYDVPRESAESLDEAPGLRVARSAAGGYEAIYVNLRGRPPYDLGRDPRVRRAIAHAIDRGVIVGEVWRGSAEPQLTLVPGSLLGEDAARVEGYAYDPERARRLLRDAGWMPGSDGIRVRNGRRLTLTLVVGFPNPEIHRPMPELVQAQLRAVGIETRIVQTADNAAYQARVRTGEGDLWAEAGGQNDADPCFLLDLLFYRGASAEPSGYARLFGPGPEYDRHIERCRQGETVAEVRSAASEALRVLVDEAVVVIPLAGTYRVWGLSEAVRDFDPHPSSLSQRWDGVRVQR